MKLVPSLSLMAVLALSACGDKSSKSDSGKKRDSGEFSGQKFSVLKDEDLSISDETVSGKGSIIFKLPLGEVGSDQNYTLKFKLQDGGALNLISHADKNLENGVLLNFYRDGSELYMSSKSEESFLIVNFEDVDATNEIGLSIDVHNGESPAHVLVWSADEEHADEDEALYNSEEATKGQSQGSGTFWGLELDQASVTQATVGDARLEHHE